MKKITLFVLMAMILFSSNAFSQTIGAVTADTTIITFVHVSDNHYGLFKANFQGATNVSAKNVNAALVTKINTLPTTTLPSDDGVNAGKNVGSIDFLFDTGDISNRQESANNIQSSSASWGQYTTDYLNSLTTKDSHGNNTKVYSTPGNHDISNSIGYYKTMNPAIDATTVFSMFNLYTNPATPRTAATYNYQTDKVHYSMDYKGIHFVFCHFWPDSSERIWIDNDLKNISSSTPVLLFTHVPPEAESRFFINPNGTHNINATDQFENQLTEMFKSGLTVSTPDTIEVRGFCNWLKNHTNILGYFNGHTNYTEFYTYKGLSNDLSLNVYRVDSPMKGSASSSDETKLAFNLFQIDTKTMTMTARECLWDTNPSNPNAPIVFGAKKNSTLIPQAPPVMQFVFTSDSHYGLTKATFRGASNATAQTVNSALVNQINNMSSATLPADNGVKAGLQVGSIDFVVNTGDIANRQETGIQPDSASWSQFVTDYVNGLTVKNSAGQNSPFYIIPGNHDITNAIGYYKTMNPLKDVTSYLGIYNSMLNPIPLKTKDNFNYATDKVNYSKDFGGVHFVFIGSWPDSVNRVWMTNDLINVNQSTPVVIFSHDEPPSESKHFTNPNGTHNINSTDKFENVLSEMFKDGKLITDPNTLEQRGLADFILAHPNIKAYFHGNDHIEQFNTWSGPDNNINPPLQVFGVDSPMKGSVSASDETKLCYQFVALDSVTKLMTIRECFWNANPSQQGGALVWGASKTINLNEPRVSPPQPVMQFVFTSDSHYGLTKSTFRGASNVTSQTVNTAMINQINNMSSAVLPADNGIKSGMAVGGIDFVVSGGDIANRQETGIQPDSASWSQFVTDYVNGLTVKNSAGQKAPFYVIPGNHDISNAIGYYKSMTPAIDMTSYLGIYNMMMPQSNSGKKIIHYWHFNNTLPANGGGGIKLGAISADYSTIGNANIVYKPLPGVLYDTTGIMDNLVGDTTNQRIAYINNLNVNNAVRTRNPSDSMQFVWTLPTTNYKNIVIKYATQSSSVGSGQHRQNYSYSLDGGLNYTTANLPMAFDSAGLNWGLVTVDLSSITAINNNPNFIFRILYSAPNTGNSGNNRFDNITVEGDSVNSGGKNKDNFNYATDKVNYSKDFGGVHFVFIGSWPDSVNRVWMANDLINVNQSTPVVIFSHDEPPSESKHFTNPNGTHNINSTDKFENVLSEMFKDGKLITDPNTMEQRGLADFILAHPNIKAYFHGNDHIEQFNTWSGPDNNINPPLQVFGVDSPMKGIASASDETKLCYQFVTLDTVTKLMTIRECFWNANPSQQGGALVWGASKTINLNNTVGVTITPNHYYSNMMCVNEEIVFTPSFDKAGIYTYSWKVNNVVIGNGSTLNYKFTSTGQYEIKLNIAGNNGETGTGILNITITDQCPVTVLVNDFESCKNATPTITPVNIFGGKGTYSYSWSPSADFVNNTVKNATLKNVLYSKEYKLTATDVVTNSQGFGYPYMTVLESPSVSFDKAYLWIKNNEPVDLTNEDVLKVNVLGGISPYQYKWMNNNGISIDPTSVYPQMGSSKYLLTVTDANGCISIEKRLTIFRTNGKEIFEGIIPGLTGIGYMFSYPNPASDNISIYADFNTEMPATLKIFNLLGKEVLALSIENIQIFEQQINVSSLPLGVYTLVIETTENTFAKQFVKQ
jgi:DNA repair exonuclease SbcCD nuclease subunit